MPIAIERQDPDAILPGKFLAEGIRRNAPDGGVLYVGVFFFQEQQVQRDGGKKRGQGGLQVLAPPLAFPIIQGMFQQDHAQVQIGFRRARDRFARQEARP